VTAVRAGGGGSGTTVGAMATHATAAVPEELAGRLAKVLTAFHSDGAIPAAFGILTPEGVLSMKMKLFALAMVAVGVGTVGVLSALPAGQPAPKADAKAKAAKPDEPPKEDFGRLPQDKRPKLVEIVDGGAGQYNVPLWLDGGKRLVLIQQYGAGETKVTTVTKVAGIELVRDRATGESFASSERRGHRACLHARTLGVLLRPLGDVLVIMPPLSVTLEELDRICLAAEAGIQEATHER